jgi:GxxExxY protein
MTTDKTDSRLLYHDLSYKVVGCIYKVCNTYGFGQKEVIYQRALAEKLDIAKISYRREININIKSDDTGKILGNHKLDFLIDNKVIIELKSVKFMPRNMERQLYRYLKATPYEVGYLVNFGASKLYLKRIIYTNDRK